MRKTIAVDFDGVIHSYHKGWHDGTIYGHCKEGAVECLTELAIDFEIIIYSTRCFDRVVNGKLQKNQVEEIKQKLDEWGVPYDGIADKHNPKPLCVLFIDDNAHHFKGEWSDNMDAIIRRLKG